MAAALRRASSRLSPPPTPLRSTAIHLVVVSVWVALFALAFGHGGLLAWSIGLVYLGYDLALQIFTGVQIARIGRRADRPGPAHHDDGGGVVDVAVLIAARDEATALPGTLTALLRQTEPPQQIVIADDGSTDDTAALLRRDYRLTPEVPTLIGSTQLVWLRLPHGGKAAALNTALAATRAEVVVTVDADTVLEPGAIAALRSAFRDDRQLVGLTGVITPVCDRGLPARLLGWFQTYEYIRNFLARYAWMRIDCLQLISGAFAGFRRSALVAVGGFDAACLVEDYELVARLQRYAGEHGLHWRFGALGAAQARTEAPGTAAAFLRQRRRWFGGFLQTHWWYRAMVGDRRFGALGTVMLPVKALDTVAPLYGLTALALLVWFVVERRFDVLIPVLTVVAAKLVIDAVFAVWSLQRYRRWVGDPGRASLLGAAASTLVAPLTFTVLLHCGAALGWLTVLGGGPKWGQQRRFGIAVGESEPGP